MKTSADSMIMKQLAVITVRQAEVMGLIKILLTSLMTIFSRIRLVPTIKLIPKGRPKKEKVKTLSKLLNCPLLMQSGAHKLLLSMKRRLPAKRVMAISVNPELLLQDVWHAVGQVRLFTGRIQL